MAPRRSAAMQRAISLIQRVCDIAAPRNYLAETTNGALAGNPGPARDLAFVFDADAADGTPPTLVGPVIKAVIIQQAA